MEIDAFMEGAEESMQTLSRAVQANDKALQTALEWILLQMVNFVKQHGVWNDQSGNLRNSISVNMDAMRVFAAGEDPGPPAQHETPVIKVQGDDYTAVLSAGMEYAIWVERVEGKWVLTGAIDRFEPLLEKYFKGFLEVSKLDLEHHASIQYDRIQER